MRVLIIAPYIYNKEFKKFSKNKSGFGIMLNDIIFELSSLCDEVFVMTNIITNEKNVKNVKFIRHLWINILLSARLPQILSAFNDIENTQLSLKEKLKLIYFHINTTYILKIIKKYKPDVIHIHGIDMSTYQLTRRLSERNIKYCVTLHGIRGIDDSVKTTEFEKMIESDFLRRSDIENINMTVISSGVKERLISFFNLHNTSRISVVLNGYKKEIKEVQLNIREKYGIKGDKNILLCVGNLIKRKNQSQVIDAYNLLPNDLKNKAIIIFLGNDGLNGYLQKKVENLGLKDSIIFAGFVERDLMSSYYSESYLNIVASFDEGFGLSFIEAMSYGVPSITFSDLDAIKDIYSQESFILASGRTTRDLADAIQKGLNFNWNRESIKELSNNFTLTKMAANYLEFYRRMQDA